MVLSKGIKKAALALCIFAFILSALPAPNLAAEPASQTESVTIAPKNTARRPDAEWAKN